MAIDTRNKRSSAMQVGLPWRNMLPAPDNAIDQADRQHVGLMYAGILAAEPVAGLLSPIALLTLVESPAALLAFIETPVGVLTLVESPIAIVEVSLD